MSWRKVGGINRSSTNVYNSNISNNANNTISLGTSTTHEQDQAAHGSETTKFLEKIVNDNSFNSYGLIAYYDFSYNQSPSKIENRSENENMSSIDISNIDLELYGSNHPIYFKEYLLQNDGGAHLDKYKQLPLLSDSGIDVYNDLSDTPMVYFNSSSDTLVSKNNLDLTKGATDISNNLDSNWHALTLNVWVSIAENTNNNGFMIFGLDSSASMIDTTFTSDLSRNNMEENIYLFYPGNDTNGITNTNRIQFYWSKDVSNNSNYGFEQINEYIDVPGNTEEETNQIKQWKMITLVLKNDKAFIYSNTKLLKVINTSGKIPINKKFLINGKKFYNPTNGNGWTDGSNSSVFLSDYKIYNKALSSEEIEYIYTVNNAKPLNNIQRLTNFNSKTTYLRTKFTVEDNSEFTGTVSIYDNQEVFGRTSLLNNTYISGSLGLGIENPREKLDVLGNVRASGNLYLGYENDLSKGIYFSGTPGDSNPLFKHTFIEERFYDPSINDVSDDTLQASELLIFKGNDINHYSQVDDLEQHTFDTRADRIRLRAGAIVLDTYDSTLNLTNEDRYKQNTRLVVDGEGHVGIGIADPRVQLDVSGKVSITDSRDNIYITDDLLPDTKELGRENIALGINVYSDENFQGIGNIGIGIDSLRKLTTGDRNVAIGYHSLSENQDGSANISIGYNAMEKAVGSSNTAIGFSSLINYSGNLNTAIGFNSGNGVAQGQNNIFIGPNTGTVSSENTSEISNTITIGANAKVPKSNIIVFGDDKMEQVSFPGTISFAVGLPDRFQDPGSRLHIDISVNEQDDGRYTRPKDISNNRVNKAKFRSHVDDL